MSRCVEISRPLRSALALGLGWSIAAVALAQAPAPSPSTSSIRALQNTKDADRTRSATPKDAAVTATTPRPSKRPLMRCWQEGRLIYEGTGMTAPAPAASAAIELRSSNAVALQIFDLKNGLCLLDHTPD